MVRLGISLLAVGALLAQGPVPLKPGAVEGMVVNSATRAPVAKATVSLASGPAWPDRALGQRQFSRVGVSDESGKFRIDNVEPGAYHVEFVQAPGYLYQPSRSRPVSVAEEQLLAGVVLELMPMGTISGRVLDADGEPLQFAQIAVMEYRYANGTKSLHTVDGATTDGRGEYRVFRLVPGRYFVNAWLPPGQMRNGVLQGEWLPPNTHRATPELGYVPVFYPNGPDASQATAVLLAAGGETRGIDFRLRQVPVYHIRGTLSGYDPGGPPASVSVAPCPTPDGAAEYSGKIQAGGRFDVSGVAAGAYCLTLAQGGETRTLYASESVSVKDSNLEGVTLRSLPAFVVPGAVQVEGPAADTGNVVIVCEPLSPSATTPNTALVEDRKFTLEGAVPGAYRVRANRLPDNMYLKSIQYGDQNLTEPAVTLRPGGALLTVILGSDAGVLTGTVQTENGVAGGNMIVTVAGGGALQWAPLDAGGHFLVTNLAPGEYQVYAWEEGDPSLAEVPEFRQEFSSYVAPVTITPGAATKAQVKAIPAEEIRQVKARYR